MLIGAKPRGPGMERVDLMRANAAIFKGQGKVAFLFELNSLHIWVLGFGPVREPQCESRSRGKSCQHQLFDRDDERARTLSLLFQRHDSPRSESRRVVTGGTAERARESRPQRCDLG